MQHLSTENRYLADLPSIGTRSTFERMFLASWGFDDTPLQQFAEQCCAKYDRRCDLSEDPKAPWRSMPGMPSFYRISHEEIAAKYEDAQVLGFTGDRHEWRRLVFDSRPPEERRR